MLLEAFKTLKYHFECRPQRPSNGQAPLWGGISVKWQLNLYITPLYYEIIHNDTGSTGLLFLYMYWWMMACIFFLSVLTLRWRTTVCETGAQCCLMMMSSSEDYSWYQIFQCQRVRHVGWGATTNHSGETSHVCLWSFRDGCRQTGAETISQLIAELIEKINHHLSWWLIAPRSHFPTFLVPCLMW